jgi:xanthine/CO dehydrogenase XdhC/CoxF family maturation factor
MKEINRIVRAYHSWAKEQEIVLATVVNVEGSSYRRIGARMIIAANGNWIGGISGGCLEGDLLKHAKKVMLNSRCSVITYDTREDDNYQIGVGLGCQGKIDVFLQPIDKNNPDPIQILENCLKYREVEVLLIPFRSSNSSDELIGQMAFDNDLLKSPLVSVMYSEIKDARVAGKSGVRQIEYYGEKVDVLVEVIKPNTRLIIIGENYDIYPFIGLANEMGWEIHLVAKMKKLNKAILQKVNKVWHPDDLEKIALDNYTAVVSMAHDVKTDSRSLEYFYSKDVGYFGMLGPRKRFFRMKEKLGLSDHQTKHIQAPIGLDIGAANPEEISAAICAEIVRIFNGGDGISLSQKPGYIHERKEEYVNR